MTRNPLPSDMPQPRDSLRIGVNLFPLTLRGGGMRQYVLDLLPWLVRLSAHRFVLFHGPQGQPSVAQILRRLGPAERNRVLTMQFEDQDRILRKAHTFDVLFCPLNCLYPDLLDRPTVATLADVQERFFPEYFTPEQLRVRGELYPHTAHAATVLLTISEFSRRNICEAFGVPADKVVVTPLSPGLVDTAPDWPAALPPLPSWYIFYPANLYPHKNHALLFDALRRLRGRGVGCHCVLTGQPAEPGIGVEKEAEARGVGDRVLWLRHVAPAALRRLYEGAAALAFPSRFEGFGLPLVEAMACGCPVVATPAASVPEVVGDAALLADPTPEAFADALHRVLTDAALRADLIARGRARVERFRADLVAVRTLAAIDLAVARFARPRPHGPAAPAVSFVVRPRRGGKALVETLASVAYEATEHDEVVILAAPGGVGAEAAALAANLGSARFTPVRGGGAWLDETRRAVVCHLNEGDRLAEGATAAALNTLAEHPNAGAVVGQALGCDRRRRPRGVCYRPPRPYRAELGAPAPPAAVFWTRSFLLERRGEWTGPRWADRLLRASPERMIGLDRTLVHIPAPRPVVRPLARALVGGMPGWARRLLRRVYVRLKHVGASPSNSY